MARVTSRAARQWRMQCTLEASVDRRLRAGLAEAQRVPKRQVQLLLVLVRNLTLNHKP